MGWSLYNMAAPYLLIHYCLFKTRGLKAAIIMTAFSSTIIVASILVLVWVVLPNECVPRMHASCVPIRPSCCFRNC